MHCMAAKLAPVRELHFHPERRWRFDFAFPDKKIAVEIEGGVTNGPHKSRHTTVTGFEGDCEKYNEAAILGWRVLRFTTKMVTKGHAIVVAARALEHDLPSDFRPVSNGKTKYETVKQGALEL